MTPGTLAAMIGLSGGRCPKCERGMLTVNTQWPARSATLSCGSCGHVEMEGTMTTNIAAHPYTVRVSGDERRGYVWSCGCGLSGRDPVERHVRDTGAAHQAAHMHAYERASLHVITERADGPDLDDLVRLIRYLREHDIRVAVYNGDDDPVRLGWSAPHGFFHVVEDSPLDEGYFVGPDGAVYDANREAL
jgi:hypothetical protein